MATITNRNGTDGNDVLVYKQGGSTVVYHAGMGNDNISIPEGYNISLFLDGGNNIIKATGGTQIYIKVGATEAAGNTIIGTDNLEVNGANMVEASLGSGKDTFTFSNSNGKRTGGLSQVRGGDWGDTFNVNAGTLNYQFYGENGDDTFNVKGGSNMNFWGGAGRDSFVISGGTNNKYYGGDSEDIFNVTAAKQTITLGYGGSVSQKLYDTVNVNAGDEQTIYANLGINQINLYAGKNHVIKADIDKALSKKNGYTDEQINAGVGLGYGVDNILIAGATNVTVNTGDGKDVVVIKGGSGHNISTDGWGDTIKISGSVSNSVFAGGEANDIYEIEWSKLGKGNVIDQTTALRTDKDILNITDANSDNFTFSFIDNTLTLSDKVTGKTLDIKGWGNGLDTIAFADKTLAGDEIFPVKKVLIINDGQDHGIIKLGLKDADNEAIEGYTVNFLRGSANGIYVAYSDTYEDTLVAENTLNIDKYGKVVANVGSGYAGDAMAAYVKCGRGNDNTVLFTNSSISGKLIAAQVDTGVAMNNRVTVNGGYLTDVYGAIGNTGVFTGNSVTIEAGSVNGDVYGAKVLVNGHANDNSVEVTGGTVSGSVYGGYSAQGELKGNSVVIAGTATVTKNVYTNAGAATHDTGSVIVKDTAKVNGTIFGGRGVDTITINSGTVNAVNGLEGNDNLTVNGGKVTKLEDSAGNNTIKIAGGSVTKVLTGNGNDVITVAGGTVGTIDAGAGNDKISLDWSKFAGTIKIDQNSSSTADQDEFSITGVEYSALNFMVNGNMLIISDATNKTVEIDGWKNGFAEIIVAGKAYRERDLLAIDDTDEDIDITGDNGRFFTSDGDGTIIVSGKNNYIEAGDGMNVITLNKGADGNNLVVGSGDNVITVNGNKNTVTIDSGDNSIVLGEEGNGTISPSENKISLGDGDNTFDVYGGTNNSLITGEGYDAVGIYGGSGHTVSTGGGNDEIVVYDGNNLTLKGGTGDDWYEFDALKRSSNYTIDQSDADSSDLDVICLSNFSRGSFTITETTDSLKLINSSLSATITVKGWANCAISEIQFDDITLYYGTAADSAEEHSLLSENNSQQLVISKNS